MLNNRNRMLAGIGVAMAILTVAGCKTSNSSSGERSEGRKIDDKNITSDLKESFENDSVYKLGAVGVQTFAGVVSLSGFVSVQGQKDRAQEIAQHTDGVKEVVNGITVKPTMPATSRANESSTIYAEPQNPVIPSKSNQVNQGK